MVSVRLSLGGLAVFSPGPLMPEVKDVLKTLGNDNVRYLIAPDAEHYLYLADWAAVYPTASRLGPSTLSPKLKLPLTIAFNRDNQRDVSLDSDFLADFDYEFVGAAANEIILYYKPDRTLLVADLIMNLPAREQYSRSKEACDAGLLTRACTAIRGVEGHPLTWQKRLVWAIASADRKAFDDSITRTAKWQLERIVVCHGEVIDENAARSWQGVFSSHLH
jgi:hypothetical protein